MLYFVYELVDPRTNAAVYVGITNNPNQRFQAHLSDSKTNDKKSEWIKQLREVCSEPRMRVLEVVETREEAHEREKYWIQKYLGQGIALANINLVCPTPGNSPKLLRNSDANREHRPQRVEGDRVLLSTAQACEIASVSSTYIQRLLRNERVEGVKMGRDWFVYEDSLRAFLAQPRKRGRPHKDGAQEDVRSSHTKDVDHGQEVQETRKA